ncbi:MAG: hypothetical protein ABIR11_06150 [Candidatus Limnocylindrales bacterium]
MSTDSAHRRTYPTDDDVEGHRLSSNDTETVVVDDAGDDVEGHRLASNDSETIVVDDAG